MDITLETVQAQALQLPAAQRAQLLTRLMDSLDEDADIEAAWNDESLRREQQLDVGEAVVVPFEESLERLKALARE